MPVKTPAGSAQRSQPSAATSGSSNPDPPLRGFDRLQLLHDAEPIPIDPGPRYPSVLDAIMGVAGRLPYPAGGFQAPPDAGVSALSGYPDRHHLALAEKVLGRQPEIWNARQQSPKRHDQ